jgi:4-hydroxyphenylacetate 3-monooxygenase
LICRQATAAETADAYAHPLSLLGEEMDALVVFDDVFVPRGRIFALGAPELADLRFFAATARGEYWAHLLRLWVHAEFLLGLAQLVVNALDTGELPLVRDQLGRLVEYATVLRAGAIAAAELATTVGEGIMLPDLALCIALRSYAVEMYPSMLSLVQELCGQGVVMRFSERDFSHPEIGPQLSRYLDGAATSARIRNRIMNLVWDVTASPLAGRVEVYERLQALSPAQTRQLMYTEADRRELVDRVLKYVEMSTEADEPQRKAL